MYYELDLYSAVAKPLLTPGGYVSILQPAIAQSALGYGGLLVIRSTLEDPSSSGYYAYDLSCPVENERETRLFVNERLEAECPLCKSTYSILYGGGAPTGGQSQFALTSYRTYRVGNKIFITNR